MKVQSIQANTFGLRKLTSFQELCSKRGGIIEEMSANDIKDFVKHMKQVVEKAKLNAIKAKETAKKVLLK